MNKFVCTLICEISFILFSSNKKVKQDNYQVDFMLNIPSTVVDPYYRYKMPVMQLEIEGRGSGIKTKIVNLQDVARHLRTSESYILKYFGFEKGSQTMIKVSEKTDKNAQASTSYYILGMFKGDDFLKLLDIFIDKFILCPSTFGFMQSVNYQKWYFMFRMTRSMENVIHACLMGRLIISTKYAPLFSKIHLLFHLKKQNSLIKKWNKRNKAKLLKKKNKNDLANPLFYYVHGR